ncbi:MAG: hypothetical protein HUU15_17550 [Candidatus Brocadiae bacterium]|nr:hypothetical protein [Candidatus Brocadiia bacterium]
MNRLGTWAFGAFVAALAMADWCPSLAPADGDEAALPAATVNGVGIRAEAREVKVGDAVERHFVLVLSGKGSGTISVECQETRSNPGSRMMPAPTTLWKRDVAFDTGTATEIDLGAMPEAKGWVTHALVMPAELGNVALGWWENTPKLADGDLVIEVEDGDAVEEAVVADEVK